MPDKKVTTGIDAPVAKSRHGRRDAVAGFFVPAKSDFAKRANIIGGNTFSDGWAELTNAMATLNQAMEQPAGVLASEAEEVIAGQKSGDTLPPVHPGEILQEEFLTPMGLTPYAVSGMLNVPRTRIERLVNGITSMTTDTALRLERLLGMPAEFWMNLQISHDLAQARTNLPQDVQGISLFAPSETPATLGMSIFDHD